MHYPPTIFHIFRTYWFYGVADPNRLGHMAAVGEIPSVFSEFHGGAGPHKSLYASKFYAPGVRSVATLGGGAILCKLVETKTAE